MKYYTTGEIEMYTNFLLTFRAHQSEARLLSIVFRKQTCLALVSPERE